MYHIKSPGQKGFKRGKAMLEECLNSDTCTSSAKVSLPSFFLYFVRGNPNSENHRE